MKCPKCQADNTDTARFCSNCAAPLTEADEVHPSFTKTLETPVEKLTRGTLFAGRYEIIEELGRGGMGAVYRVEDIKAEEEIALKLIRPEISSDKKTIERFKNELTTARKIAHRNVCRMFDLGEEKGTHFITMEYVAGEDLKDFIKRSKQLSIPTIISIAKQICGGLSEAHRLGVVHRDLKPSNIMIDKQGNAKLMDFGIARSHESEGITGAGIIIGTPEYMSPEQADTTDVDLRSDIYSLGVILYEMLTGQIPFQGETPLALAMKHKSETPRNPEELNPRIPEDLNRAILKCLEKDKEARYQSVDELSHELNRIEKGIPTTERQIPKRKPITSKEITVKFNLRKLLIPTLLVLAATVSAVIVFRGSKLDVDPNRIVVAVFENQTNDEQLDPLGRMASDWISQILSQAGDLEIVPTMAVLQAYKVLPSKEDAPHGAKILRALAEGTGAGTLVYGTYYLTNLELHFQAHIMDVQSQSLIHSLEPVKGKLEDKMDVVQLLSQKVMDSLAVYFDEQYGKFSATLRKQPPLYEAYQEFLLGTESFGVDYTEAIRHFTRAVELDPKFILPQFYIAVAYGNQGRYPEAGKRIQFIHENREQLDPFYSHMLDWYTADLKGKREVALRAIIKAEKMVPQNIIINYMRGFCELEVNHPQETVKTYAKMDSVDPEILYSRIVGYWRIGYLTDAHHMLSDYKQALKEAQKGRRYYPNILWLRADEARALAALGRIDAVRAVIEESLDVVSSRGTPGDVMQVAARALRAHGHMEASLDIANRAVEWYQNQIQLNEVIEGIHQDLATALYTAERWDEAQAAFEELTGNDPGNIEYKGRIGSLAARRGDRKSALEIIEELEAIDRSYLFGKHMYMCVRIAALLGEKEQAMAFLRKAFSRGLKYGVYLLHEMDLEPLRSYEPFQELLKPKG